MLLTRKLEQLLKTHWVDILDRDQIMKMVLENVRNTDFKTIRQTYIYPRQTVMSVTNFQVDGECFVIWIEFQVPKGEGVAIGTQIYNLRLNGEIHLQENHGTCFLPENVS